MYTVTSQRYRYLLSLLLLIVMPRLWAQVKGPVSYVDPFIGTAKSSVPTKWGSEGGVYPGAVAPSGYLQLSPETRVSGARGYDYSDSVIYYFSCFHHFSGFPAGSAGTFLVMPVDSRAGFLPGTYKRRFSHRDEQAGPGYYRVLFRDNHTLAEATATTRAGMFRFTFAAGVMPELFIGDSGRFHAAVRFSEPPVSRQPLAGGYLAKFSPSPSGSKVILLSISASMVSKESAERNITVELNKGFDQLREDTRREWAKALSVIEVSDSSEANKTIFYTALYHSLIMPWVISDVDGHYRGADRQVHTVKGRNAYGGFSPWDTFRSLHPLLCLLYPDKQREMVLSMLDVFSQTGHLPTESMTGNHAVPIVADSYLKGIKGIDSALAYMAMRKSLADTPYLQNDMEVFRRQGYIPFSYPESVTRTVEYAYDDWALAQFAARVMGQGADAQHFTKSSYAYRHLFHAGEMAMLPRQDSLFKLQPGTTGYKEGDQWIYSYFAPHHQQDLVNLMGGRELFVSRLDKALRDGQIIFDNETVFHIPWLFNGAGAPHKTQQWIGDILHKRFSATPGGLPGNDDLGSMSSWYVFSAMGIYPLCPGNPEYTVSTPLFRSVRIHLQNGRTIHIERDGTAPYIRSVTWDGQPYVSITIPHARIAQGGNIRFETTSTPDNKWPALNVTKKGKPDLRLLDFTLSKRKVMPHELFWARFSLRNNGSLGTKQVALKINGKVHSYKNCLVDSGMTIIDSIPCRLYYTGSAQLALDEAKGMTITVVKPDHPYPDQPDVRDLALIPLIKKGDMQECSFTVQNTGGEARSFHIPVKVSDSIYFVTDVRLQPGEQLRITRRFKPAKEGPYTLEIFQAREKFVIYADNKATLLLDLAMDQPKGDRVIEDHSWFGNNGRLIGKSAEPSRILLGKDCFVEIPNAPSLDVMGTTITMMAWVYPTASAEGLVDLFTKGDVHVLQVSDGKRLTFFAGGWGRGECSVALPDNWMNNWHHVAGVCDGASLKVYMDGQLKAVLPLEDKANLSVANKWNIGRNEEFPSARIFDGHMESVKVFAAPLTAAEIREVMGHR